MDDPDSVTGYKPTIDFAADELLPYLRERYDISRDPERVIAMGTSRRGLVATMLAFERPDAIARVISMSGSFYWRQNENEEFEWLAKQIALNDTKPMNLYLAAGKLETVVTPNNQGHYLLSTNRHLRNVLWAKNYKMQYHEFMGVHHELCWQGEIARGLIYHLGRNHH